MCKHSLERSGLTRTLLACLLALTCWPLTAFGNESTPSIVLILDDLGNNYHQTLRAISLPGKVTCAFLPHSPVSSRLAPRAHKLDKEVMVHLPMQALTEQTLGAGGLTLDMLEQDFKASVIDSLASVPHARGISNHMGSLLTRHPGHMSWLMEAISGSESARLFFVDSRTTGSTVAWRIAGEHGVPRLMRDVFLDAVPGDAAYVRNQFLRLLKLARKNGYAVGIAHPYPETLIVLEEQLAMLAKRGVKLVAASELASIPRSTPGLSVAAED